MERAMSYLTRRIIGGASTVYSIKLEVVAGAPVSHQVYELNVNDAFIYINIPLT